jgi:hypothetical protein
MNNTTGSPWNETKIAACRAFGAGSTVMEAVNDVHAHFGGTDWVPNSDDAGLIVAEVDQMISMLDQAILRARDQIGKIPGFEAEI